MDTSNLILLIILGAGLAMMAWERLRPARPLPEVEGWWGRAILLNGCQLGMVFVAGWTWDKVLRAASLLDLGDTIPAWLGGLIGYLVSTFVYYWWHRARHEVDWLWRGFHQVHHSPSRLEVITSFYKHPLEIAANGILTSLIVYTFLGLGFEAAAWNTLFSALAEFFYHLNVRTPRWLGYLIQRPEMHRVHHARGAHRFNYGDLPIWDLLFGTFHNPADFDEPCGFEPDKEVALGPMLLLRDVHQGAPAPKGRARLRRWGLGLLLLLGTAHIAGDLLALAHPAAGRALGGAAALTLASPRPKVFTKVGEHEPFGFAFTLDVEYEDGERVTGLPLDAARYSRLPGPYMARNVYGAMLAYSPVLEPATLHAVLGYGLCAGGELAQVLDRPQGVARATVHTTARGQGPAVADVEVTCGER
jgi:sterol desaturase/sphingolipid hydroxylase (fatty acid hydroxylase superfamily)